MKGNGYAYIELFAETQGLRHDGWNTAPPQKTKQTKVNYWRIKKPDENRRIERGYVMTRSEWSEEELATIKKMWADGKTALEISKKLDGKSRSSVLAKARRLNLASRAGKTTQAKPKSAGQNVTATVTPKKRKKHKPTLERERISKTAFGEKCDLFSLKSNKCCWPIGNPQDKENFGFCAAKKQSGKPYCEEHSSIAYQ